MVHSKSSFDSALERLIKLAIKEGILTSEQRFGPHDLKRIGITGTKGPLGEKQQASGHKAQWIPDADDFDVPVVSTPEKQ